MRNKGRLQLFLLWLSKKAHGDAAFSYRNVWGNRFSRWARWLGDE